MDSVEATTGNKENVRGEIKFQLKDFELFCVCTRCECFWFDLLVFNRAPLKQRTLYFFFSARRVCLNPFPDFPNQRDFNNEPEAVFKDIKKPLMYTHPRIWWCSWNQAKGDSCNHFYWLCKSQLKVVVDKWGWWKFMWKGNSRPEGNHWYWEPRGMITGWCLLPFFR